MAREPTYRKAAMSDDRPMERGPQQVSKIRSSVDFMASMDELRTQAVAA